MRKVYLCLEYIKKLCAYYLLEFFNYESQDRTCNSINVNDFQVPEPNLEILFTQAYFYGTVCKVTVNILKLFVILKFLLGSTF